MKTVKADSAARRVALLGMMTALALIFGYVEYLIPFNYGILGVKLGLANLAVVVSLYVLSTREALLIDIARILVSGFLFGSGVMILYSLSGGLLSFAIMAIAKKSGKLSTAGVSILGGVFHNIGQLAVAVLATETLKLSYYLPVLVISGLVTGFLIGITAGRVIPLIIKVFHK